MPNNSATTVVEESGRTKRKRVARKHELNGCLCGDVVQPSDPEARAVKCKQAGCETEWVSRACYQFHLVLLTVGMVSTILRA